MKIQDVAELDVVDRFLYWIKERHRIYLRRERGKPKPWTDDEVLQRYFFTNPYRENDKTTVWFRENIRHPLRNKSEAFMATVIFRWFNRISTGGELSGYGKSPYGLLVDWKRLSAITCLRRIAERGDRVFTGAYMIKAGNGPKGCKIPGVCGAISNVWKERGRLVRLCQISRSLETVWEALREFPYLGGFMSYEIVTDLRHTYLLKDATDIMTWANPGPGCKRGLIRLQGGTPGEDTINKSQMLPAMKDLLKVCNRRLPKSMLRFEMREVEHSLCEFDKYERARLGQGKMKRRYVGV